MSTNQETLEKLYTAVAKGLLNRIKGGDATAKDYENAMRFLKDNDITADPENNQELQDLADEIKVFDNEVHDEEEEFGKPPSGF
jgi:hypothetical protein